MRTSLRPYDHLHLPSPQPLVPSSPSRTPSLSPPQEPIYEIKLHLPAKGGATLFEGFASLLAPEYLKEEEGNGYFCETCGKKCDAARQTRIRDLPEVRH